jgi:mono/diheme cytochrome c family protein
MISARMSRARELLLLLFSCLAVAAVSAACGTESISVPKSAGAVYHGAVLFNQRCAGCHTLSYAATHGSALNVRTAEYNNGPNFDVRCERPLTRVLYAIENGGFSGAIMPQNVVVGQEAVDVAKFVATYSGRKAPKIPGVVPCAREPIGSIPALTAGGTAAATATAKKASAKTAKAAPKVRAKGRTAAGAKRAAKKRP